MMFNEVASRYPERDKSTNSRILQVSSYDPVRFHQSYLAINCFNAYEKERLLNLEGKILFKFNSKF